MLNIREFNHKLINVSHVEIGIQLIKLWNVEVPILGSHSENRWNYGKIVQENGLKFWP